MKRYGEIASEGGGVDSIFNFLLSIMERKGEICDRSYLNTKHIKIGREADAIRQMTAIKP